MKKLILSAIIVTLSTITAHADTFSVVVKWKEQADYQAAFDTPKQRVLRAKQRTENVSNSQAKVIASPAVTVSELSGYTLEHVRSGANRTDTYTVEANTFLEAKQALMATGYFDYVSPNTFYKSDPVNVSSPARQATPSNSYQAQAVETNAFNDPFFSKQVVFQSQGAYTMGAGDFVKAMKYVAANKQITRKVRVAVLDQGKWLNEDITWSTDEVDMLSGQVAATCASGDDNHGGGDVICPMSDYQIGTRDNDATDKRWQFTYDSNNNPISDGTVDIGGHGLSIASAIAMKNDNGLGITALNDDGDVELIPVRVMNPDGGGSNDIIDGIYWAAGMSVADVNDISAPADVINMSLGGNDANGCSDALQDAVNYAYERGVTVVVAAGNSSVDAANFTTASCDNVLTVGAHDLSGEITSFSNFGKLVDVSMLGSSVHAARINGSVYAQDAQSLASLCTRPDGTIGGNDGCFATISGTSIASPLVAAMVVQIKMVQPTLNPAEIMAIIKNTAPRYDTNEIGQTTQRKHLLPNAGAGNGYKAVASTFSSETIETGNVVHQFAHIVNDDQTVYLDAIADLIGKEKACNSYQANFGYFDKPVANIHYEMYTSNTQDVDLTTSNAELIVPVGGGVLAYPSTTINMQGSTRLGVRACDSGNCGDIFELDLASAQKPTYCI
ncbi:S8 family serine peptidase [Colwellia sp. BRX8-9]|uniref:S8 family serine peptidase n=1 Tax=Colwellia sp. BRX8-9 TaxID=2759831 RepID=UPI0015F46809|nr:S8 family serine peptidase [Colwellia sp. BRX8-9]MBA6346991.1 S8 family serine peptidase [Colwellia sp. BRX8-9]